MKEIREKIKSVLNEIPSSGSFCSNHEGKFVFPGLELDGLGELSYPINEIQVKSIIEIAHKAHFGKGFETVFDENVRSAWEIDANKIKFNGTQWDSFLKSALQAIKPDLGIEKYEVSAHLYKMLIYEKGDFFLAHKDTEKEKGMFGTLIIGLPSKYKGGELFVRFDGKEETVNFSDASANNKIPYVAFYADCDHEIKPITEGYRVCLVYNLVQKNTENEIQLESLKTYVNKLKNILISEENDTFLSPKIVLLGHQYTPENFSKDSLKLDDRVKAEVILNAAEESGYYAKMCLVTSCVQGAPEVGSYDWGYDEDDGDEDSMMGEVYDEWIDIKNWSENEETPALRKLDVEEEDLIATFNLTDGEPILKDYEGYMGNYGPDLTHWYHYAAIVIWPKKHHLELLLKQSVENQLEWLEYYNKKRKSLNAEEIAVCEKIVNSELTVNHFRNSNPIPYNAVIDWYIGYDDVACFNKLGYRSLLSLFSKIDEFHWVQLIEKYPSADLSFVFSTAGKTNDITNVSHILSILNTLSESSQDNSSFIQEQLQQLPSYFTEIISLAGNNIALVNNSSLANLLQTEERFPQSEVWKNDIINLLCQHKDRKFINFVLIQTLMKSKIKTSFLTSLMDFCEVNLSDRVQNKPQAPSNWTRILIDDSYNKKCWNILKDFLASPDQEIFDYRKNQQERTEMENAIRNTEVDLKTETIKIGSPHTLRITKTQASFEKKLKEWKEDENLLHRFLEYRKV
jgi:hypothetical protein